MESPPGLGWSKAKSKKRVWKKVEINSFELNTVSKVKSSGPLTATPDKDMWITIDSGASENVINRSTAPQFKVMPSTGSNAGVTYVTASGQEMANEGEKDVKVVTQEGHKCLLKMQVTDVRKPLMSVARICDAGHNVTFTNGGGFIEHVTSGQVTRFDRVDNVYRLRVDLAESGFARQGK